MSGYDQKTSQAALSDLKHVLLEFALKFDVRRRKHAVTIMTRNSRGLIGHRDPACTNQLCGPGCISLFGYLKVINAEIGLNDVPVKKRSLSAKNQGDDVRPYKKIRQWAKNSISSADSRLHRWGLGQGTLMPLRRDGLGVLRTILVNSDPSAKNSKIA